jgi:hypothetical protein
MRRSIDDRGVGSMPSLPQPAIDNTTNSASDTVPGCPEPLSVPGAALCPGTESGETGRAVTTAIPNLFRIVGSPLSAAREHPG